MSIERNPKLWNGGNRKAALEQARLRTEEAIAAGGWRCPACGDGGLPARKICETCSGAGYLTALSSMRITDQNH